MGIIARFRDIMAANINALLDRAEDPEKMIDQLMRNLASDLAEVKKERHEDAAEPIASNMVLAMVRSIEARNTCQNSMLRY